jgi:DNA-binding CsgD family transcriptional regulator
MQTINHSKHQTTPTPLGPNFDGHVQAVSERAHLQTSIAATTLPELESGAPNEFQRNLFLGHWKLLEHFELEGVRYFVFSPNDRGEALTPRERHILERAAAGESDWTAAAALGCSPSTVAIHRQRAMAKIGIFSRALLSQVLALAAGGSNGSTTGGSVQKLRGGSFIANGRNLYVLCSPSLSERLPPVLTASERAVAALLLEGLSNRDVAAMRGTSVRTVANQVSAILRKLRIGSRTEIGPLLFSTLRSQVVAASGSTA